MSADNWAKCPRCVSRAEVALRQRDVSVAAGYGTVPVEAFDAARADLAAAWEAHREWKAHRTFREDYEVFGAEDGTVEVTYSGSCSECGLGLTFEHSHSLDVDGPS